MDETLQILMYKLSGFLLVVLTLYIIFSNVKRRKKILVDSPKSIGKASVKVGKDTAKSIGKTWSNLKSKKPQLPGGVGYKTNSTPAITTPEKVPKKEVVIPLSNYDENIAEFVYTKSCGEWKLDSEYNGNSVAFCAVGGWDEKSQRYKIWLYDPFEHQDIRKQKTNSYRVSNEGRIERSYS
jgi:hypothetical protein